MANRILFIIMPLILPFLTRSQVFTDDLELQHNGDVYPVHGSAAFSCRARDSHITNVRVLLNGQKVEELNYDNGILRNRTFSSGRIARLYILNLLPEFNNSAIQCEGTLNGSSVLSSIRLKIRIQGVAAIADCSLTGPRIDTVSSFVDGSNCTYQFNMTSEVSSTSLLVVDHHTGVSIDLREQSFKSNVIVFTCDCVTGNQVYNVTVNASSNGCWALSSTTISNHSILGINCKIDASHIRCMTSYFTNSPASGVLIIIVCSNGSVHHLLLNRAESLNHTFNLPCDGHILVHAYDIEEDRRLRSGVIYPADSSHLLVSGNGTQNQVADSLDCNVTSDGVTSISALCHSQDPGVTGFQLIVDNSGPKDARRFSVNHTDDPSSPVVVQVEENGPECLAIVFAIKGENGVLYSNSSFYMGNIQLGSAKPSTKPSTKSKNGEGKTRIIVAVVFVIIVLVVSLLPLTLIVCKKWVKNIKQWYKSPTVPDRSQNEVPIVLDPQNGVSTPQDEIPDPKNKVPTEIPILPDPKNEVSTPQDKIRTLQDEIPILPDPQDKVPTPQDKIPILPDPKNEVPTPQDKIPILPDPKNEVPTPRDKIPILPGPQDELPILPDPQDELPVLPDPQDELPIVPDLKNEVPTPQDEIPLDPQNKVPTPQDEPVRAKVPENEPQIVVRTEEDRTDEDRTDEVTAGREVATPDAETQESYEGKTTEDEHECKEYKTSHVLPKAIDQKFSEQQTSHDSNCLKSTIKNELDFNEATSDQENYENGGLDIRVFPYQCGETPDANEALTLVTPDADNKKLKTFKDDTTVGETMMNTRNPKQITKAM